MILKYTVQNKDINKTINQILSENFHVSVRLYNKLVSKHYILLNNAITDTRIVPAVGDVLSINLDYEEDNSNIVSTQIDLDILYEDDWLLILNKPAGIPVHPSIAHYENSLSNGVKFYFDSINLHKKIRPVNRLDLDTSGVIIFAKNEYIQECLIKQMNTKTFSKEYIAIVEGTFEKSSGVIDLPISRKENSIIERCVSFETGKKAVTEYTVLSTNSVSCYEKTSNTCFNDKCQSNYSNNKSQANSITYSVVKCHLITGRTHQIRVHMAYVGHPLLGDFLYNSNNDSKSKCQTLQPACTMPASKKVSHNNCSQLIGRQALHSYCVSFIHPVSKQLLRIDCDLPEDMKKLAQISN